MTGFNSKRQAAWNKFADPWQGIAKWKDPELDPIDTAQPVAWQWLDSGNFRKKIPKNSNVLEWNPLYAKSPKREWVGLTDEEISACSKGNITRNGFARNVLAKSKEKNFD